MASFLLHSSCMGSCRYCHYLHVEGGNGAETDRDVYISYAKEGEKKVEVAKASVDYFVKKYLSYY